MKTLQEFKEALLNNRPADLVEHWLANDHVAACESPARYQAFKAHVVHHVPSATDVWIVGTANWIFSLNPEKNFKEFDETSDIDVVVVSEPAFKDAWDQMRSFERARFYQLSAEEKQRLIRNSQNVYAGFVTPLWIPHFNKFRSNFKRTLNALQSKEVGFKEVKMLFFRNKTEVIDYYRRGISSARKRLKNEV